MTPPNLERPIADWERLAKGLETSMGLVRRGEETSPPLVRFHSGLHLPADIVIHTARSKMECDCFSLAG